jgi:ABC-2 type transport system ATP-binding protein
MTDAITMTGVGKSFGAVTALRDFDLSVRTGEVHGFLGPNGAGKSTAIRVLLGLLRSDTGRSVLLGGDPWRDAGTLHRRLAYVPGDVALWPTLTGGEVIDLLGRLRGTVDTSRRDELIELFQLDPRRKCRTYSKGNRQKVALVAALASGAELLILDEPTSGLDPLMEATFAQQIRAERERGRTVLQSSHVLSEVEQLCDRISIIRAGVRVETGTLADMRHLTRTSVHAETTVVPMGLAELSGVHGVAVEGNRVRFDVDGGALTPALSLLARAGVRTLSASPPTLEDLFLRHYAASAPGADVPPGTAFPSGSAVPPDTARRSATPS